MLHELAARKVVEVFVRGLATGPENPLNECVREPAETMDFTVLARRWLGECSELPAIDMYAADLADIEITSFLDTEQMVFDYSGVPVPRPSRRNHYVLRTDGAAPGGRAAGGFVIEGLQAGKVTEAFSIGRARDPFSAEHAALQGGLLRLEREIPDMSGVSIDVVTDAKGLVAMIEKRAFKTECRVAHTKKVLRSFLKKGATVRLAWVGREHNTEADAAAKSVKERRDAVVEGLDEATRSLYNQGPGHALSFREARTVSRVRINRWREGVAAEAAEKSHTMRHLMEVSAGGRSAAISPKCCWGRDAEVLYTMARLDCWKLPGQMGIGVAEVGRRPWCGLCGVELFSTGHLYECETTIASRGDLGMGNMQELPDEHARFLKRIMKTNRGAWFTTG